MKNGIQNVYLMYMIVNIDKIPLHTRVFSRELSGFTIVKKMMKDCMKEKSKIKSPLGFPGIFLFNIIL